MLSSLISKVKNWLVQTHRSWSTKSFQRTFWSSLHFNCWLNFILAHFFRSRGSGCSFCLTYWSFCHSLEYFLAGRFCIFRNSGTVAIVMAPLYPHIQADAILFMHFLYQTCWNCAQVLEGSTCYHSFCDLPLHQADRPPSQPKWCSWKRIRWFWASAACQQETCLLQNCFDWHLNLNLLAHLFVLWWLQVYWKECFSLKPSSCYEGGLVWRQERVHLCAHLRIFWSHAYLV